MAPGPTPYAQKALVPVACEFKADTDSRIIKGYASIFDVRDHDNDIVETGAFKATIAEKFDGQQNPKVKGLWQHVDPLGRLTVLKEDSTGLYFEERVSKTSLGNDALELISDGVVDTMSIGYAPVVSEWDESEEEMRDGIPLRRLKEIDLYEVSPVTWAANDATSVSVGKSREWLKHKAGADPELRAGLDRLLITPDASLELLNYLVEAKAWMGQAEAFLRALAGPAQQKQQQQPEPEPDGRLAFLKYVTPKLSQALAAIRS